jgi:hypothetical protein
VSVCSHAGAHAIASTYDLEAGVSFGVNVSPPLDEDGGRGLAQVYWCETCGALGLLTDESMPPRWFACTASFHPGAHTYNGCSLCGHGEHDGRTCNYSRNGFGRCACTGARPV